MLPSTRPVARPYKNLISTPSCPGRSVMNQVQHNDKGTERKKNQLKLPVYWHFYMCATTFTKNFSRSREPSRFKWRPPSLTANNSLFGFPSWRNTLYVCTNLIFLSLHKPTSCLLMDLTLSLDLSQSTGLGKMPEITMFAFEDCLITEIRLLKLLIMAPTSDEFMSFVPTCMITFLALISICPHWISLVSLTILIPENETTLASLISDTYLAIESDSIKHFNADLPESENRNKINYTHNLDLVTLYNPNIVTIPITFII